MPLLSIVVPVYSVQGYLRECLDSVLQQTFTDIEVIAVDDSSPDHSPAILDEYAALDPRVSVVHLPRNVGLGLARNAGLDRATGEYVWFIDSDDWIAAGCLRAIADRLHQTRPDLLLVDHTRVDWLGRHSRSAGRELLGRLGTSDATVRLTQEPRLLTLLTVAWNKVVRREFLSATGLRFDAGWYEDMPFTFPVLVAADRITSVPRVCYHYRKGRQEAITSSTSERHFEVFDQWARVFARLDRLGPRADARIRRLVFECMLWHLLVVQAEPGRLPAGTRRAYFGLMSAYYRRYADPHSAGIVGMDRATGQLRPLPPLDQLRRRLIAEDRYVPFRTLRQVRLGVDRGRGLARRGKRRLATGLRAGGAIGRAGVGRAWYEVQRRLPLDEHLAVYAAYWYRGVNCNPAAIDATARRLAPGVRAVWVLDPGPALEAPPGTAYVVNGTLPYYRALARAKYLINNVNFPDFVVKRPGSVHVQTHHGTPVKVMGLDQNKFPVGAQGMDMKKLMARNDRWDFSLTSNAHTSEVWSRAYPSRYQTLEYGYPRNDRLATAAPGDVATVRERLGLSGRVVLYAPTFREYLPGYQQFLAIEEFADDLGPDWTVLVRAHYFYKGGVPVAHPAVRDVSAYPVVEDLLLASDVLVTDYSSVMFDFAVLDRPIAIFAPDWEAYRRTRGVTFDLLGQPPGVVTTNQVDLQDAFRSGELTGDAATKAREAFRAKFCYLDDGRAADRVVRRVFASALAPGV